jgi:hypothetical protein
VPFFVGIVRGELSTLTALIFSSPVLFLEFAMSVPRSPNEQKRIKHAALLAAKPDARFLVQLIAGPNARGVDQKNKTAPYQGAAAYSSVMDSNLAVRAPLRADSLNHAA